LEKYYNYFPQSSIEEIDIPEHAWNPKKTTVISFFIEENGGKVK
jgi:hypothetical protein